MRALEGLRGRVLAPPPTTARARRQWLVARQQGVGASEVATLLGMSPWADDTPLAVWLSKLDPDSSREATEEMRWGLEYEAPIARVFRSRYSRELGIRVEPTPGLLQHEDFPWLLATPDRIGAVRGTYKAACPIEIKTASAFSRRDWAEGVPDWYQIQVQVQMAVTGLDYGLLVVVFGGSHMPQPFRIERDQTAIDLIYEAVSTWWQRHVVERVIPEPSVADLSRLPAVWPGISGSSITLPDSLAARLALRARMAHRVKQLEAAMARTDLAAKVAMGDAQVALDGQGQQVAKWSRFTKRVVDMEAMRRERPEMVAKYTRAEGGQRFSVRG